MSEQLLSEKEYFPAISLYEYKQLFYRDIEALYETLNNLKIEILHNQYCDVRC